MPVGSILPMSKLGSENRHEPSRCAFDVRDLLYCSCGQYYGCFLHILTLSVDSDHFVRLYECGLLTLTKLHPFVFALTCVFLWRCCLYSFGIIGNQDFLALVIPPLVSSFV